jgi:hypothetical protein
MHAAMANFEYHSQCVLLRGFLPFADLDSDFPYRSKQPHITLSPSSKVSGHSNILSIAQVCVLQISVNTSIRDRQTTAEEQYSPAPSPGGGK